MLEEQCMASGSRSPRDFVLPRWIRPFHRCWKLLTCIWGGLLFSALVYGISKQLSAAWIAQERVQFLLDGLDEVGASARTGCIQAINTYRQAHLVPLVVCSRSQEYESQPAHLILPGAVEIQ